jgi:hypothetical protein
MNCGSESGGPSFVLAGGGSGAELLIGSSRDFIPMGFEFRRKNGKNGQSRRSRRINKLRVEIDPNCLLSQAATAPQCAPWDPAGLLRRASRDASAPTPASTGPPTTCRYPSRARLASQRTRRMSPRAPRRAIPRCGGTGMTLSTSRVRGASFATSWFQSAATQVLQSRNPLTCRPRDSLIGGPARIGSRHRFRLAAAALMRAARKARPLGGLRY